MKVEEIMKEAKVVNKNLSVLEASELMTKEGIGSLVIDFENGDYGIITEKDITKDFKDSNKKLSDVAPKGIVTLEKICTLEEAAAIMKEHKIKRLPVVEDKKVIGIITVTELIENSKDLNENDFWIN
jgi:CBS domain-containing protein